ncbi:MAG: S8 family serine peptidase, partial [Halorubrum sp.]
MIRNSSMQTFAALFAAIMVISMMAPAAGAAVAGTSDATDLDSGVESFDAETERTVEETDDVVSQQDPDGVSIDDALEDAFEDPDADSVDVVVRLPAADTDGVMGADAALDTMQAHAADTQTTVLRFAESHPGIDVKQQLWIANAVLLEVDPQQTGLDEIAAVEGVDRLHANFELTTMDEGATASDAETEDAEAEEAEDDAESEDEPEAADYETTYGLEMINATEVWDQYGTQGEGVEVAVLDTGMDDDHPDLPELDDETWQEWDSDGNPIDTEPSDASGHGTHVSGTVAGAEEPDGDVDTYGVAPGIELYHGAAIPGGTGSFVQVAAAMEWSVDEAEVDITTMSLGADGYNSDMVEPSENARDAGVVLVASAGNSGDGVSGSPGNVYPNFASGAVNENYDVASFSSGEEITTSTAYPDAPDYWPDEYIVPDAAAPGVDVLSSVPGGGYDDTYSGTSMSAPHKAGAFALMLSASGGDADRDMLRDAMKDTAWKPDDWDEPDDEKDTRYGYGIIDAAAATDQVALESGVEGTVTDTDGEPIEGAVVEIEETGVEVETDADGNYTALAAPGNYTVTASGFGFEAHSESVEVPDDETFVEQDFELEDALGVELLQGQPEAIEAGDSFDVEVNVANLETFTAETSGDYDGDVTFELNGDEIEDGEEVELGGLTGEATLTVMTEPDTSGELEIEHTFSGEGDSVSVTTGPTDVFAEFTPVAVVDDGTHGDDVYDRLNEALPESFDVSLIDGGEAVDAAEDDTYDAYVVQDIDEMHVEDFAMHTDGPAPGVVWLDNWGSSSNAIPAKSTVLENPEDTADGFTSPNPDVEILDEHALFEGVGDVGDTLQIHSATFADMSWYDGYDGETIGYVQSGSVTDGGGVGVDEEKRTALLSSWGSSTFVDSGDFTEEADHILANAVDWASTEPQWQLVEDQPGWSAPGEMFGAEFNVNDLEKVKVSLHEDSTADEEDLDLYIDGSVNAFDQWRAYDPAISPDDFMIEIESDEDAVGSVILETEFDFADEEADSATTETATHTDDVEGDADVTVTTGPTSVYEQPLNVGDDGDVDTIQEGLDLAPDGAEIEIAPGEYDEVVSIETDDLTITGDGATIVAPDSDADDGHAHVTVDADGTHLAGVDVETPEGLFGLSVEGTMNTTLDDVAVHGANHAFHVEDSEHVELSELSTEGADDIGIHVVDSEHVDVHHAEAMDTGHGIAVEDSEHVDVVDAHVEDADTGVASMSSYYVDIDAAAVSSTTGDGVEVTDSEYVDVADAHVEHAEGAGISSMDSYSVNVTEATVTDAMHGITVMGGTVDHVVDSHVADADIGIAVHDNADVMDVSDNEIANASTGISLADAGTAASVTTNDVDAETGVAADGVTDSVEVHFNDLESTETAIASEDGVFEAQLNWFGDDGPMANNGIEGDTVYSPFLTSMHDEVDMNTTEIAVDLRMDADDSYTVGVPAASDQTIDEVFQSDFEGAIYGYDAAAGEWQMLAGDDGVNSLSAILVVAEEDTHATLHFQSDEDPSTPGSVDLHSGWNLVSPSAYHDEEFAFYTEGTSSTEYYTPSTWHSAYTHADGHLGEHVVDDDHVNPFGGYWVGIGAEGDGYTHFSAMEQDPTMSDYHEMLDPDAPDVPGAPPEDPGDDPEEPDDVDVAVVDEEDHFDGAIAEFLDGQLDDEY